ncbi:MAG: N(5)-(carboxyethyl)ornithine synthase [Fibrobacterota bacterium]
MKNSFLGVIGTSRKEDEKRVPLHPDHLSRLPQSVRKQLIFEEGYGIPFGLDDNYFVSQAGGVASRHSLLQDIGSVIIAKPTQADLLEIQEGGVIWGYAHCVQQHDITQTAIDRNLTLIAFEDMFVWSPDGHTGRHTFYKNNEMAGYCAVIHALQLRGIDGHYGNQRKVLIFSFGAVSRGAVYALKAHGFRDITICVQRPDHEVREEILDVHYVRIRGGTSTEARMVSIEHDGTVRPLSELIHASEIIINGTYQDTDTPVNFVTEDEKEVFMPGSLIIDVSCDEGMGFYFAQPTSFKHPMRCIDRIHYYAVDHTPSYLWESATRSISAALVVYVPTLLEGRESWLKNSTVRRAINIDSGHIKKEAILRFQNRNHQTPYRYKS